MQLKTRAAGVAISTYCITSPVLLLGEAISSPYQSSPSDYPSSSRLTKTTDPDENLIAYFDDLYKFFLRKLTTVECNPSLSKAEENKLKAMLDELLRVKGMIAEEGVAK